MNKQQSATRYSKRGVKRTFRRHQT